MLRGPPITNQTDAGDDTRQDAIGGTPICSINGMKWINMHLGGISMDDIGGKGRKGGQTGGGMGREKGGGEWRQKERKRIATIIGERGSPERDI